MIEKVFSQTEWRKVIDKFSKEVHNNKYKRLDYSTFCLLSTITCAEIIVTYYYKGRNSEINIKYFKYLPSTDNSFGSFLYKEYFAPKEDDIMKCADCTSVSGTGGASIYNSTVDYSLASNAAAINVYSNELAMDTKTSYINTGCYTTGSTAYDFDSISSITLETSKINQALNDCTKALEDFKNQQEKEKKEKEKNMKGFNFDFGPVNSDSIKMSMYGLAVKNAAGVYVSYNPEAQEIIDVDIMSFDCKKFLYKIPVAISEINVGDIIIHNKKPMFVLSLPYENVKTLECVDVMSGERKDIFTTKNMFGFDYYTKVVSLFNMTAAAPSPDSPFGNFLPLLMLGENGNDIDPMVLALMLGGQGGLNMSNPMMMYMLLGDKKEAKDLLPLMMLMGQGKTC